MYILMGRWSCAGVRKILKKLAKHVPPSEPVPGYLALEISHPHEPGYRLLQVRIHHLRSPGPFGGASLHMPL